MALFETTMYCTVPGDAGWCENSFAPFTVIQMALQVKSGGGGASRCDNWLLPTCYAIL